MPIYEYSCTRCGHITEEWVKSFNSPNSEPCPECGAEAVRIVSDTSFQLKGSGWYVTDYKKSGASQSHEPSGDHASGASSGVSSETSSETASGVSSDVSSSGASSESSSTAPSSTETSKAEASSSASATESKTASAAA